MGLLALALALSLHVTFCFAGARPPVRTARQSLMRMGKHGMLCDDMGLGKTMQTICLILLVRSFLCTHGWLLAID